MRGAVLVALTGCFVKPGPPGGAGSSDPDAPVDSTRGDAPIIDCSGVQFDDAQRTFTSIPELLAEPTMRGDQLELYFTSDPNRDDMIYAFDIRRATRLGTGFGWTVDPSTPTFNASGEPDMDASLTADGLMIAFVSRRSGEDRGYIATRLDADSEWSTADPIPGLETMPMTTLDLSADGGTLYFPDASNPSNLRVATRADRGEPFSLLPSLLGMNRSFPSVSTDGLELYYNNGASILYARRASTSVMFGVGVQLFGDAFDPDLSPDGTTLIATAAAGGGMYVYSRACTTNQ